MKRSDARHLERVPRLLYMFMLQKGGADPGAEEEYRKGRNLGGHQGQELAESDIIAENQATGRKMIGSEKENKQMPRRIKTKRMMRI